MASFMHDEQPPPAAVVPVVPCSTICHPATGEIRGAHSAISLSLYRVRSWVISVRLSGAPSHGTSLLHAAGDSILFRRRLVHLRAVI